METLSLHAAEAWLSQTMHGNFEHKRARNSCRFFELQHLLAGLKASDLAARSAPDTGREDLRQNAWLKLEAF